MEDPTFPRVLRYAALLCIAESFLVTAALLPFGWPPSAGDARLLVIFLGAATVVRLLCNTPVTTIAFLRATPWIRSGRRTRIALLNASVYAAGLLLLVLPALAFGLVTPTEIPPIYPLFFGACLVSPFMPRPRPPFGLSDASTHAA